MTFVTGPTTNPMPASSPRSATGEPPPARWPWGWLTVFAGAMLLYGFTASTTIGWQDSGQFVLRVVRGQTTDPFGLCCVHPLHFWLGTFATKILPAGPPAALALVSAVFGALAVANVFGLVRTLTGKVFAAALAACGLAVAHTFWRFSTFVEVYSITAALLTAEAWALILWDRTRKPGWLVAMFLANGLGLANHDLALLTLPVIGIVLLLALRTTNASWKTFVFCGLAWFAGAGIYLVMIAHDARVNHDLAGAIRSALFGKFERQVLSNGPLRAYTAISIAFTLLSFPNIMLPAAVWGAVRGRKLGIGPLSFWSLMAMIAIHLGFILRYAVIDQYTFLMPVYALLAVFSGIGFASVTRDLRPNVSRALLSVAVASIALTPVLYPVASTVARRFDVLGSYARNKPYRDDYRYLFVPWGRGENSAQRMSEEAADLAGHNGLILVEDQMAAWAVDYQVWRHSLSEAGVECPPTNSAILAAVSKGRRVVLVPARTDLPPTLPPIGIWKGNGALFVLETTARGH